MLLEFIARYYKFFWIGLGAMCFIKIILANLFQGSLQGMNGMVYALFKWYGEEEQEMEDVTGRRLMMRILNILTLMVYGIMLIVLFATLIPLVIGV